MDKFGKNASLKLTFISSKSTEIIEDTESFKRNNPMKAPDSDRTTKRPIE
jgi:hypothetical protein